MEEKTNIENLEQQTKKINYLDLYTTEGFDMYENILKHSQKEQNNNSIESNKYLDII